MLCGLEEETVDHLFSQCVTTRYFMANAHDNFQLEDLGDDVRAIWDRWANKNKNLLGLITGWWVIWDLRNRVIFMASETNPIVGVYKIKQLMDQWKTLTLD